MKYLLLTFVAVIACCACVRAQNVETVPNYKLAGEIMMIHEKVGLPVDSAAVYLKDFERLPESKPSETIFKSRLDNDTYIISFRKMGVTWYKLLSAPFPIRFYQPLKRQSP